MRVLFLGSPAPQSQAAAKFLTTCGHDVTAAFGDWQTPFPGAAHAWHGGLIVSFLSRWIVPADMLAKAPAVNFHPGPPQYPGIGCLNWALYEGSTTYGVTMHRMAPEVDAGNILAVRYFPILPADCVETLLTRTHDELLSLFRAEMPCILQAPERVNGAGCDARWCGRKRSRAELDALAEVSADMPLEEIRRRIRATEYSRWRPYAMIGGQKYELKGEKP